MYEELLKDFDESGLDPLNTVVRCRTQTEAEIFLKYLCAKGVRHNKDIAILKDSWMEHQEHTCYHISKQSWCYDTWYMENRPEYHISDFCDVYKCQICDNNTDPPMSFDDLINGVSE